MKTLNPSLSERANRVGPLDHTPHTQHQPKGHEQPASREDPQLCPTRKSWFILVLCRTGYPEKHKTNEHGYKANKHGARPPRPFYRR